jgi:hypothetical protein
MSNFFKSVFLLSLILLGCQSDYENAQLFKLKGEETGINFENNLTYTEEFNPYTYRNFFNGGGVALGDINNDGLLDIYFTGNMVDNRLYLNKGNWKFDDITNKAGVTCSNVWSTGATFVDINGDGWLDIYVCKSGKPEGANRHNELFINNGDLTFSEKSKEYGLDINGLSVQAAFFDYDKDGDLDCYVLTNSVKSIGGFDLIKDQRKIADSNGNKLLKNENGKFIDVTEEAGIFSSKIGFGLGITLSDFNGDNWTDIFISNDFFERDYLYINNQKGGFDESLESYFQSTSLGSMGADAADLDNDLLSDVFVTEMLPASIERQRTKAMFESWDKFNLAIKQGYFYQFPRNALQRNMGNKTFFEISRLSDVAATDWSWTSLIVDMDNDGLKDIFITNGIYKDLLDRDYLTYMANDENVRSILKSKNEVIKKLIDIMPSAPIANVAFHNKGNFTFSDVSKKWGFEDLTFSNGASYGDLDNDGALDLVVNNVNMPAFVYENNVDTLTNRSISLNLFSKSKNTKAIGAKVLIKYGEGKQAVVEKYASRGFQSASNTSVHFGVGNNLSVDSLFIHWPNGAKTVKTNLKTNIKYLFEEPNVIDLEEEIQEKEKETVFFKATELFNYKHKENYFIDFNRERLMPFMSNNEGPAMAVADVNDDGLADFFIGGAKGSVSALYLSKKDGTFIKDEKPFIENRTSEDINAKFFDGDGDGDLDLYVTSGGKAFSKNSKELADRYYINQGNGQFKKTIESLPKYQHYSSSAIAIKDYDNDGDDDIFIGERFKVSCYGQPGSGYLFENKSNNKFEVSKQPVLINLGMITDAEWVDINKDGWFDLVVAGEWMPITVLINEKGNFVNKTEQYGLSNTSGLWSTIKVIDVDNDGNKDIIAGNIGENNFFKNGLKMYINDFDKNGSFEQVICYKRDHQDFPIVDKDELLSQLPYLKNKLLYFKDYEKATINSIFDKTTIDESLVVEANHFKTTLFLNLNGKFSSFDLPQEIQYSSVKAIEVTDVNNDSINDIIFGGNQYLVKPQFGRDEASKGWLVLGSKANNKVSFPIAKSIGINGQIRNFEIIEANGKKIVVTAINNKKIQFHEIKN